MTAVRRAGGRPGSGTRGSSPPWSCGCSAAPRPWRCRRELRLWRGKGTPSQVRLAADLTGLLAEAFPERQVHGTGDAAFRGEPLVIEGTTWTTRLPASAVIHGPKPPPAGKRGRPRKKGARIGTCKDAAATAGWQDVTVRIYGNEQTVQAAAWPGLWYGSFAFLVQTLMICWYAMSCDPAAGLQQRRQRSPWYTAKATPAATDMHGALRDALTPTRINAISPGDGQSRKSTPSTLTSEVQTA